jgi:GNAT superfamily N-acetyltransferase
MPHDAEASEYLFSYGTLQLEAVQLATFGRRLSGTRDVLAGFACTMLEIAEATTVALSGKSKHPIVTFSGRSGDAVHGTVFRLTPEEIKQADRYEVAPYERVAVTLQSGIRAWVYADVRDSAVIEPLSLPLSDSDAQGLGELLVDAVASGAAVSFMDDLTSDRAVAWWQRMTADASKRAIFLVARDGQGIVGSVQVHPAWAPNQPHRGELAKLLVHRRRRGKGLGRQLMHAIEDAARRAGFRLLTLDAKAGSVADRLYRELGWTHVGTIPRYALDPDGTPHGAAIFYKEL